MTIRVGIDASEPSRIALTWALNRANQLNEDLVLVHVLDDEWGQAGHAYAQAEEIEAARILADAADFAARIAPDVRIASKSVHGSMAYSLAAEAKPDDLIVVGTHKTGYSRGRVIGTRGIVVASVAPCDVAVIPDTSSLVRSGVVVGVVPGRQWTDATITGAREADRLGQGLYLVHAAPHGRPENTETRELFAAAAAVAASTSPSVIIHSRVSSQAPVDALLDAGHNASLLVLGVSRRPPERAGFIGSVTHDVLLNINAPVLVARNQHHQAPEEQHPQP